MTSPGADGQASSSADANRGASTGLKLLIGCLGLVGLTLVVLAVAVGVGGFALKRGVESAFGGLDEHREASEVLRRLEEEHPFAVPEDGVVTEDQLLRFFAATDHAWEELASWGAETSSLGERAGSGEARGLRDIVSGAKSLAGGARARIVLAESLEAAGMSLGEYAWTGLTMQRAAKAAERTSDNSGIPDANLELVERYGARIPRLGEDSPGGAPDEAAGQETVLAVAVLWGMTEGSTWHALGLDTMGALPRQ